MSRVFSNDQQSLFPTRIKDFNKTVLVSNLPGNVIEHTLWVHLRVLPSEEILHTRVVSDPFFSARSQGLIFCKRSGHARMLTEQLNHQMYENRILDTVLLKDRIDEIRHLEELILRKQQSYAPDVHAKYVDVTFIGTMPNRCSFLAHQFRKCGTIREIEERTRSLVRVTYNYLSEAYIASLVFHDVSVGGVLLKVKLARRPEMDIAVLRVMVNEEHGRLLNPFDRHVA